MTAKKCPVGVEVRYESDPGEYLRDGVGTLLLRTCTSYLARARRLVRPGDGVCSAVFRPASSPVRNDGLHRDIPSGGPN